MANTSTQLAFDTNGTLNRVWLAAHWDKKLSKNSISTHDITESVSIIKAPGNVYSLRISGYLLLGLTKIYSKKCILALEELEQSLQSLSQTNTSSAPEVLKEIGITEVPEKLRLVPLKRPEMLTPLTKTFKSFEKPKKIEKPQPVVQEEPQAEDNDFLGITASFLDDVEMAEQWLKKDDEEEEVVPELPAKRPRERIWQSFINTNIVDDVVLPDPPEQTRQNIKNEEPQEKELEGKNQKDLKEQKEQKEQKDAKGHKDGKNHKDIKDHKESRDNNDHKEQKDHKSSKTKAARQKTTKRIVKDVQFDLVIDHESHIGLDCTFDIVKNTRLYQPMAEILPNDIEQMFYIPIIKEIAPELENFYLSHVKIQRLKNLFRDEEEKEPVILSSVVPERPENPIIPNPPPVVNEPPPPVPEPEPMPKVEKVEEKTEETWSSRTLKLLKLLKIRLSNQKNLYFEELSKKLDRRVMACGFYEILQLCLKDFIIIDRHQEKILLKPTDRLMRVSLM